MFQISNYIYSLNASKQKKIDVMKFVDMTIIFCCSSDKRQNLLCLKCVPHNKIYCIFVKIIDMSGRNYKLYIMKKINGKYVLVTYN